jgi:rhamnosyltransferase subunit B
LERKLDAVKKSRNGRVALLAWELGGGMGHARRLLHLARELKRRGWKPVVAARQLWACLDEYQLAAVPIIQAPITRFHPPPRGTSFEARGYADIIAACGYQHVETLWPSVVGWDGLIDSLRPDVIIADYSPILALASFDRIPLIVVGSGFAVPPSHLPRLPLLRPNGTMTLDEDAILANAVEVQRRRGRSAPKSIASLIGGQAAFVCTFPEIDVYSDNRLTPATGPLSPTFQPLEKVKDGRSAFAYLEAEHPAIDAVLSVLLKTGVGVEAFIRNATPPQKQNWRNAGISIYDAPPNLSEALGRSSVIVHHGGIGTMEASLALGRPQLLAPLHLEQMANTRQLMKLGFASCLLPELPASANLDTASAMIVSEASAERASAAAELIASRGPSSTLEQIMTSCEMLAAR